MSRRGKILLTLGVTLVVAVLIPVVHHYQLRAATEAYIAQLKAQGEPMELAQVIPLPAASEQNGVPFLTNSLTNLENKYKCIVQTNPPTAMREVLPGRAMVGWQQPNIVGFDNDDLASLSTNARLWTNTWEELGDELAAEEGNLDSFQSLTNHPMLDFKLDYTEGDSIQLEHLIQLSRSAHWLSAAVEHDLHEGKTTKACAELRAMLAIVKGQTKEPFETSQLTRSAVASIAADTTWEILQDPSVSDFDLASLQRDWESCEFIDAAKKTFLAERVMNFHSMRHYLESPSDLWNSVNGNDSDIFRRWCKFLWRWFWVYADEKRMMQTYQVLTDALRMAETNHSFQTTQSFAHTNFNRLGFEGPFPQEGTFRMDVDPTAVHWLLSENAFDSYTLLRRAMIFESVRNMTVAAIALKRYELRHHQFPPTLNAMTPDILKTIPLDYMNGKQLHYRKNPNGTFLLYSVGEDGADNGGKPSTHKWWEFYWFAHELDLVWPQPATPEQIQNYYAHPPK